MKDKIIFRSGNVLHVFRVGKSLNEKISSGEEKIVQTYHFSKAQFDFVANGGKSWPNLVHHSLTGDNCFDCKFAIKGCYTHKFFQASGFMATIRSITKLFPSWEDLPEISDEIRSNIISVCADRYVRFGSYGEPVTMPFTLVSAMADGAKQWSGYTHQWQNPLFANYKKFFMASTDDETTGKADGWREFLATEVDKKSDFIGCPASKEAGYKASCEKCGLCSGTMGKGSKSVSINLH